VQHCNKIVAVEETTGAIGEISRRESLKAESDTFEGTGHGTLVAGRQKAPGRGRRGQRGFLMLVDAERQSDAGRRA
jgi:hypothetical protein